MSPGSVQPVNGGSPFEEGNGAIFERITTQDFLLGGTATSSAEFAVTGIANNAPVATLSASTGNGLSLTGATATLQSLNLNTLTIGGATTGNIVLNSGSDLITLSDNTVKAAIYSPRYVRSTG